MILQRLKTIKELVLGKLDAILSKLDKVNANLDRTNEITTSSNDFVKSFAHNHNSLLRASTHLIEVQKHQQNLQSQLLKAIREIKSEQLRLFETIQKVEQKAAERLIINDDQFKTLQRQNMLMLYYLSNPIHLETSTSSNREAAPPMTASQAIEREKAQEDLENLKTFQSLGFSASCIYDIGASDGCWTQAISEIFPGATFHLFEPLAEMFEPYKSGLDTLKMTPIDCTVHPVALGQKSGHSSIGIPHNPTGSSLLVEQESDYFPTSAQVPVFSLDEAVEKFSLPIPQIIKIDTQGYELEILKGATQTLKQVEMLILETWLSREYGDNTPLMPEVIDWLAEYGFFLLDFSANYRNQAGILIAQDCIFVRGINSFLKSEYDRTFSHSGVVI